MDFKFIRFAFSPAKSISNKKQKLRNLVSCSIFFKASMFVYTCLVNDTRVLSTWMVAKRLPSSETQEQSVWSGEKAGRKFSSTGERAPGYRLSSNYFQKFKQMPARIITSIVPNRRIASPGLFSWVRTRRLLCGHTLPGFVHQACACKGNFYFLLS